MSSRSWIQNETLFNALNYLGILHLRFTTKARGYKVVGQEKDSGVTPHAFRSAKSVREWTLALISELPCWELESQMDSQIFRVRLQGSKPIALRNYLYHWKVIEAYMSKMSLHCPFGHLWHKLWPKERLIVKLAIWLPTIKSQDSTRFPCVQAMYDILLERSRRRLQLCLRPRRNQRSTHEVMRFQSRGNPNCGNSLGTKNHLDVAPMENYRVYHKGEGGGFPKSGPWWFLCVRVAHGSS
jgi:hypothetical protein